MAAFFREKGLAQMADGFERELLKARRDRATGLVKCIGCNGAGWTEHPRVEDLGSVVVRSICWLCRGAAVEL